MTHQLKSGRSALEGKKTLAYMLRLMRNGHDVCDIAERYGRTPAEIAAYLRQRGYSTAGNPLPPAPVYDRPLKASAGGTAGYVSASDHDAPVLPFKPVVYRQKPEQRTVIDWGTVPEATVVDKYVERQRRRESLSRHVQRSPGGGRGGPAPKFSPREDAIIRQRYESGETAKGLAREFKVSDVTIANAIRRAGGKTGGRSGRWRLHQEQRRLASQDQQEVAS